MTSLARPVYQRNEAGVQSPARAVNPDTGRLGGTLRLTPWANSLRRNAPDGATFVPADALLAVPGITARAFGLAAVLYRYPADAPPTITEAAAAVAEGRDALLSAAQVLIAAGFVEPVHVKAPIPPALRMAVLRRDGYRCVVCGIDEDLMADHVIPEALGGETTFDNLQTMCRPCNSAKGGRA